MWTIDIESHAIEFGKPLLPEPVSCALLSPEGEATFYAWGHPSGNTCTKEEFGEVLKSVWGGELLGHNSCTFDIPILQHYFGLPQRDPLLNHNTLYLAYLQRVTLW